MNEKIRAPLKFWRPTLLWMLFIFLLSSVPGRDIPKIQIPHLDKVFHFIEYSVLGVLMVRSLVRTRPGVPIPGSAVLAAVLVILFAFSDEWHQTFIPGRSSEWGDIGVDAVAAVLGICFFLIVRSLPPKPPESPSA